MASALTPGLSEFNPSFWAPKEPIKALYTIDLKVDPREALLEGEEEIELVNSTARPLSRLVFKWSPGSRGNMKVFNNDIPLESLSKYPMLFEISDPLRPGDTARLSARFSFDIPQLKYLRLIDFHPRLNWGYPHHDDFKVKVKVPKDYELVTSGLFDASLGRYMAKDVANFGVVATEGFLSADGKADDIYVKAIFTEKGRGCGEFVLHEALDVIKFYKEILGFYPQQILSIIPGSETAGGGYPFATNIIAIHGQEGFERASDWWRWITAHEIGHQYFGERVLEGDVLGEEELGWLWIGLGIYLDREYSRAHGLNLGIHRYREYIEGIRKGFDTTIERPFERYAAIDFDFNNVVIHGKGFSIICALEVVIGKETLSSIFRKILSEFKGRPLGAYKFQEICEDESGQDLAWFFRQWLRTNAYLSYAVESIEAKHYGERHATKVKVKRLGLIGMPIPVEAHFEDGSVQRKLTDRTLLLNELEFQSKAKLIDVRLDPDDVLPLIYPPPEPKEMEVAGEITGLPWTGIGERAREAYERALNAGLKSGSLWFKLGLTLYDGDYYNEALEAFKRAEELSNEPLDAFASVVWQGHVLDLLGKRVEALEFYRRAKEMRVELKMQHDQYRMIINREWVDERLKNPFQRKS
jgi:tetratricopeptide (TPR) repeat protein